MFSNFRQCYQVMKDHAKIVKMLFWMIQTPKKEVFGYFLEFGLLDRLDIAYYERTKCFPIFSKTTRSWRIIQKSKKCIFELFNDPKKRFLAIILTYLSWVNLILHMVIVQNGSQEWATLPGLKGSFKKYEFVNDPMSQ